MSFTIHSADALTTSGEQPFPLDTLSPTSESLTGADLLQTISEPLPPSLHMGYAVRMGIDPSFTKACVLRAARSDTQTRSADDTIGSVPTADAPPEEDVAGARPERLTGQLEAPTNQRPADTSYDPVDAPSSLSAASEIVSDTPSIRLRPGDLLAQAERQPGQATLRAVPASELFRAHYADMARKAQGAGPVNEERAKIDANYAVGLHNGGVPVKGISHNKDGTTTFKTDIGDWTPLPHALGIAKPGDLLPPRGKPAGAENLLKMAREAQGDGRIDQDRVEHDAKWAGIFEQAGLNVSGIVHNTDGSTTFKTDLGTWTMTPAQLGILLAQPGEETKRRGQPGAKPQHESDKSDHRTPAAGRTGAPGGGATGVGGNSMRQPGPAANPTAAAAPNAAKNQEGIGSFLEGLVAGDLSENDSWSKTGGQIVGGFIPLYGQVADARDTAAAIRDVWQGKEGGWFNLGAAFIGWIPGIGDAIKSSMRAGRRIGKGVAKEAVERTAKVGANQIMDEAAGRAARGVDPKVKSISNKGAIKPKFTKDGKVIPYKGTEDDAITIINKKYAGQVVEKNGLRVRYDANGFPEFPSKFDTYIDDSLLKNGDRGSHFADANEALAKELRANPDLAKKMGLRKDQVDHILKVPPSADSPPDLTWHHHQEVGRMQLVDRELHDTFRHTGGFSIWGK